MEKAVSLKDLRKFIKPFLSKQQTQSRKIKRGRPPKYKEDIILTLFLYQKLFNLSFRETLKHAKQQRFPTPSLHDYHHRVQNLDKELLQTLIKEASKAFAISLKEVGNLAGH